MGVFVHGTGNSIVTAQNATPTGMPVTITVENVVFTASGCPFASGSNGELSMSLHAPEVTIP